LGLVLLGEGFLARLLRWAASRPAVERCNPLSAIAASQVRLKAAF